jgi:excisionase family DNA binding protein
VARSTAKSNVVQFPTAEAPKIKEKEIMRAVEAAEYIGVSKKTLLGYCKRRLINFMRYPDSSFRFRKSALDLFMAQCEIKASGKAA